MKTLRDIVGGMTREQWVLLLLAGLGAILRIEYLREFSMQPVFALTIGPDTAEYHARATELLSGRIFPAAPDIHAPLYSWFLAAAYHLTGGSVGAVRALQLAMNFAATLSLVPLLKRLGATFKVRATFLAAAMLTPVVVFHQAELISETLLLPLLAPTLWLLSLNEECKKRRFAAGVGLGLLILTHGLMLFFAGAEILWGVIRRRGREALLLTAGVLVVTLPVIAAKSLHYRRPEPLQANGAFNLWIGHHAGATGGCCLRPGMMWRAPLEQAKAEAKARNVSETRVFLERIGAFYREHPGEAAVLPLKKLILLLAPYEPISGGDPEARIRETPVQMLGTGCMAVVMALALWGIVVAIRHKEGAYKHFYLLAGATAAALLLTVVSGRYRQGMLPGIMLLAALGAAELRPRYLTALTAAGILLGWFLLPNLLTIDPEAAALRGEAYCRRGEYALAEPYLRYAESAIDDPARFDNMLGAIAEKRGDVAEAERRYRNVIARDPDFPDAWLNLGHLLFRQKGKRSEAETLIRASLTRPPESASAHNLLGVAAVERGDLSEAETQFIRAVRLEPGRREYEVNLSNCRRLKDAKRKGAK